jgi:hypothetical protein
MTIGVNHLGFAVSYRSTKPVEPSQCARIQAAIKEASRGKTWLLSEAVWVARQADGHLWGASKPNFQPHPDDVAAATMENLPDATISDVVQILCDISRAEGVDWEVSHDGSGGPIGFIRNGIADPDVLAQIEAFADVCQILSELEGGLEEGFDAADTNPFRAEDDDDDPPILKFPPRQP